MSAPASNLSSRSARTAGPPPVPGSAPDTVLEIENLDITLGDTQLLENVSLSIGAGEILALTGESGSGKSLTALAAMGLLPRSMRTHGAIRLSGQDLLSLRETALCAIRGKDIGMVFQEPMTALNPLQTIGAQIAETIRQHAAPPLRATERTRDLLDRVGLDLPESRYPHELSGGQRQRVVIAIALAMRPRLIIADEPTTALDVTTQAQILNLLRDLTRGDGISLLMITHDLAVIAGMADRIAVMQNGRVVETAPTAELLARPRHPYSQALLAASAHQARLPEHAPGKALLSARRVRCSYPLPRAHPFAKPRSFTAVRDVSFTVHSGERVGLVGESGCGKSTLTRALLGLHPLAGGEISLDGIAMTSDQRPTRATQARIQVVFQDPYGSFNPRHRVARLLTEPFHLLDTPPKGVVRRDAIADALTAVGLSPDDAQKHIHAFSGGQRQRLAIARALIINPALIVFDEAVSALDVRVRAQILDLLADLSRTRQLAWLFISHDLSVVRSITDRVMVMQAGEIVEEGPTRRLFDAPQHPYTQSLLAAAPRLPDTAALSAPQD